MLRGVLVVALGLGVYPASAKPLVVACASSMQKAMNDIITAFAATADGCEVEAVYGSSGKLSAQIRNGAPFDFFFSADTTYPAALVEAELTAGPMRIYAVGRLAVWSPRTGISVLADLAGPEFRHIAVANPRLAPYGQRAMEVLEAERLLDMIEPRLVYGENISQAMHYVESGAADAGLVAYSLVLAHAAAEPGHYLLVDEQLHHPLEQGYAKLARAARDPCARAFEKFIGGEAAAGILEAHGFTPVPEAVP